MSIPLDVAYVDSDGRIIRVVHRIKPWFLGPVVPSSAWVVELSAGAAKVTRTQVGDLIELVEEGTTSQGASASTDHVEEKAETSSKTRKPGNWQAGKEGNWQRSFPGSNLGRKE